MDRDFFLNAGLHYEPSSQFPSWKLMSSVDQSNVDRFNNFDSVLASMAPSPVSNSIASAGATHYNSQLNSPPPQQQKSNWPIVDHLLKEATPNLRNPVPFGPNLPSLAGDPGFAERAAKFSCFGSKSFNGRTSQLGLNSNTPDLQFRSTVSQISKLPRVSSSPLLKIDGSAIKIQENKELMEPRTENGLGFDNKTNSNEESSVSEQLEIDLRSNNDDLNSRKRKIVSLKGKAKEIASPIVKEEGNDDLNSKKVKKTEEDINDETEKKSKVPEPPKDYIHVRARRGQATDSHSLAERVRREKISERMKLLQDLVPGCNKVTGKALMLDEIINYVQSLQHQVEFLSMKLATVNPRQDFDMNSHISKDMIQSNGHMSQQMYQMESKTSDFYHQNPQEEAGLFVGSAPITQSPVDPLNQVHGFSQTFSQFSRFEGDDLHSIVKMGFGESRNQSPEMKIEL